MPNARLLIALFVLLAGVPAWAQRTGRVGLKLGGSLTRYRGDDTYAGGSNRGGFCGGGVLHLPISRVFSVQPEFLYSQKGASSQAFVLPNNMAVTGNQRLSYVEVPVLAKLRSHAGLFVEAGPTLSYLLSASAELSGQNNYDNRANFKDLEVGYAAGVGYQGQGTKALLLGVRYTRGLTPVFKAGAYRGIGGEPDIYNQAFQLYAGFIFFGRPPADFPQ
ncbi:hypothetical protein ACVWYF_000955 [Hymenobacter sp. UYAg731]